MTKEQWEAVESKLSSIWGTVDLLVDGHRIHARVGQVQKYRFAITVFVDGVIKGEWISRDSEIGRKFWCPVRRSLFSKRGISRSQAKYLAKKYPPVMIPSPLFYSFTTFKRHLIANNESIELIEDESSPAVVRKTEGSLQLVTRDQIKEACNADTH